MTPACESIPSLLRAPNVLFICYPRLPGTCMPALLQHLAPALGQLASPAPLHLAAFDLVQAHNEIRSFLEPLQL